MSKFALFFDDTTQKFKRISDVTYDSGLFKIHNISDSSTPTLALKKERSANLQDGDVLSEFKTIAVPVKNDPERVMGLSQFLFKTGNKSNYLLKTDLGSGLVNSFKIDEELKYSFFNPSGTAVSLKVHASSVAVDYTLPSTSGGPGQVLGTDGNGRLFWLNSSFSWNKYEFTIAPGGEYSVTAGEVLTGKSIEVLVDGQLMRSGALNDYTVSGATVIFNYTLTEGSWVFISVFSTLELVNNDFDIVGSPQSTFTTSGDISALMVKVYENGVLRREGVSYDYIISGSSVVFNNPIQVGAWVRVAVYGGS